jgi:N-methylhydantoinase A
MHHILVPPRPGLLSAIGLLHADVRGDFSLTRLVTAKPASLPAINDGFSELSRRGDAWLALEQMDGAEASREWRVDMRYLGQESGLGVKLDCDHIDELLLARVTDLFHQRHHDAYGYSMPDQPVEVVTLRLVVTVVRPTPPQVQIQRPGSLAHAIQGQRHVWFPETGFIPTSIYDREKLPTGAEVDGPCIIEQMDTTTVVPPEAKLSVDTLGYLHIDVKPLRKE